MPSSPVCAPILCRCSVPSLFVSPVVPMTCLPRRQHGRGFSHGLREDGYAWCEAELLYCLVTLVLAVILELALLRLFNARSSNSGNTSTSTTRAIYVSPLKALCSERARDWARKFGRLVREIQFLVQSSVVNGAMLNRVVDQGADLPRDHGRHRPRLCQHEERRHYNHHPRKVGQHDPQVSQAPRRTCVCVNHSHRVCFGRWKSNTKFMDTVGLILIDEVHLLNEERGACLEGAAV